MIMSLRVLAIFCLIFVQQSLCADKEKTRKQRDALLNPYVLDLLADKEHEFVEIEFHEQFQKRSLPGKQKQPTGKRMRIRAFDENIELWLHPKDADLITDETPVYYSNYKIGERANVEIGMDYGILKLVGTILEDPIHLASLVIGKDKLGRTIVNGQIGGKNLGIVSLSDPIGHAERDNSVEDAAFDTSSYHAVYRIESDIQTDILSGRDANEIEREDRRYSATYPRALYPEILVVVDWSTFRKQKDNLVRFLEYIMAFVNGIDLKYRVLKSPCIRLRIAGILVAESPLGVPYISRNKIKHGVFNYTNAMDRSAIFFHTIREEIPLESYDIAMTMTRLRFGLGTDATVRGSSFTGSVCKNTSQGMYSSSVIRDNGAFFGVYTAAHELGHVLGMLDDTTARDDCDYRQGYIMAEFPLFNRNSLLFSRCSLRDITKRLKNGQLKCLYNDPQKHGTRLPHLMPGQIVNQRQQCSIRGFKEACGFNTDSFCLHLHCLAADGTCMRIPEASLEGTRCSARGVHPRRFCVHGRCIRMRYA